MVKDRKWPFDYSGSSVVTFSRIGLHIAETIPIAGEEATDAECIARRAAVEHALEVEQVPVNERTWYTAEFEDGTLAGQWAHSAAEAIIACAMWHGMSVVRVIRDPDASTLADLKSGRSTKELMLW